MTFTVGKQICQVVNRKVQVKKTQTKKNPLVLRSTTMTNAISTMEKLKQLKHLYLSLLVVQCLVRFYIYLLECNTYVEDFEVSRTHLHNSKVFKVLKKDCH